MLSVNLPKRKLSLLAERIELFRSAFREAQRRPPFTIDVIVMLPDHLHTMPENDADFARRKGLGSFSRWPSIRLMALTGKIDGFREGAQPILVLLPRISL